MRISDWSSDVCSSDLVICLVAEIGPALRGDPDAVDIDDIQRIISDPRSIGNVERIILSPQESVRAEIKFLCAAMGGDAFGHDGPEPAPRFAILLDRIDVPQLDARQREREGRREIAPHRIRSEAHTSELQSLLRISYAVFCFKKNTTHHTLHK